MNSILEAILAAVGVLVIVMAIVAWAAVFVSYIAEKWGPR